MGALLYVTLGALAFFLSVACSVLRSFVAQREGERRQLDRQSDAFFYLFFSSMEGRESDANVLDSIFLCWLLLVLAYFGGGDTYFLVEVPEGSVLGARPGTNTCGLELELLTHGGERGLYYSVGVRTPLRRDFVCWCRAFVCVCERLTVSPFPVDEPASIAPRIRPSVVWCVSTCC